MYELHNSSPANTSRLRQATTRPAKGNGKALGISWPSRGEQWRTDLSGEMHVALGEQAGMSAIQGLDFPYENERT